MDKTLFLEYIKIDINDNDTMINIDDNFNIFLNGLTLNNIDFQYIGFYEEKTKDAYFYVNHRNSITSTIIHNAWQLFCNNDEIDVKIYGKYCGNYSVRDDYETERKYFYKYLMKMLVDKVFEE